jgi:hypothetical protein
MDTLTPQQIEKHISAAFDSVNLINSTIEKPMTDDLKSMVERNYKHLEIMLAKEWFSEALSEEQLENINDAIDNGKEYAN